MPAGDTTVTAYFWKNFNLTAEDGDHYSVTLFFDPKDGGEVNPYFPNSDRYNVKNGVEVTVWLNPEAGYAPVTNPLTFKNGSNPVAVGVKSLGDNKYSFIMPAKDVTMTATCEPISEWQALKNALSNSDTVNASDYDFDKDGIIKAGPGDSALSTNPDRDVTLNLGGVVIDRNLGAQTNTGGANTSDTLSSVINVGSTLTLKDTCPYRKHDGYTERGGLITGGKTNEGGGVYVDSDATFNMEGGKITGNEATGSNGGGVCVYGTFNMTGGKIINNNAVKGGVYVYDGATFEMSGRPTITGNKVGDDDNNVYLPNGVRINVTGKLNDAASVGVTMENPGVFTSDLSGNGGAENFSSDDSDYGVDVKIDGADKDEAFLSKKYSINVDSNITGGTVEPDKSKAMAGKTVTLTVTPSTGYRRDTPIVKQGDQEVPVTNDTFTMPEGDVTVLATFVRQYKVTFNSNGGSAVTSQTVDAGGTATKPATDPSKRGSTFGGWQKDGASYNFSTPVNGDITLTALWTPNALTVSDINGEMTYNGAAWTPGVTVKDGDAEPKKDTDYTVEYKDNIDAGNAAKVTVKGKGDYINSQSVTKTFTIGQAPVTITGLSVENKTYDGNTTATVTGTPVISGKVDGDDVSVTEGTAAFVDANVGTDKTVNFSGYSLSGDKTGNYKLSKQPTAKANITTKTITITAKPKTITYGDAPANDGVTYSGFVTGESETDLNGTLTYTYN